MKITVEAWEKQNMRKLSMKALGAALAAMLVFVVIGYLIKMDKITILGLTWFPAVLILKSYISIAYHQGVCDERDRKK